MLHIPTIVSQPRGKFALIYQSLFWQNKLLLVFHGKIVVVDLYEFIWNFDHFENILIFFDISKLLYPLTPCTFAANNKQTIKSPAKKFTCKLGTPDTSLKGRRTRKARKAFTSNCSISKVDMMVETTPMMTMMKSRMFQPFLR